MRAEYRFEGSWTISVPPEAVSAVLVDLERYPQWWPQVVAVASLGSEDAWVLCRSRLPYTLDLVLHAVTREPPTLQVAVSGDLEGTVQWRIAPDSDGTRLDFTQEVSVRGLLAVASPLLSPILRWNHDQMMAGCLRGLGARLDAAVQIV